MRSYTVEAFVLRMRALGEADRILTLFSRERGKLDAVAKGARKTQSKYGARLDFFNRSRVTLHAGRNLDVITGAQALSQVWERLVDPDTYLFVCYVAEMIDALCELELAIPELYEMLCEMQDALGGGTPAASFVAAVDMRMLTILGFAPELDACARCGAALQSRPFVRGRAMLSPHAGGLVCSRCLKGGFEDDGFDRASVLLALSSEEFFALRALADSSFNRAADTQLATKLSRITRAFVEYHLGRRSKSIGLLRSASDLRRPAGVS